MIHHAVRIAVISLVGMVAAVAYSGHVSAATVSVTQELKVTATVAPMRHVIVDPAGQIVRITSNTPQDVPPTVFMLSENPKHQIELSSELYALYRTHVPEGTASYGVLYSRSILSSLPRQAGSGSTVSNSPVFRTIARPASILFGYR